MCTIFDIYVRIVAFNFICGGNRSTVTRQVVDKNNVSSTTDHVYIRIEFISLLHIKDIKCTDENTCDHGYDSFIISNVSLTNMRQATCLKDEVLKFQ